MPNVLSAVIISVDEVGERRHADVEDALVRRGELPAFGNNSVGVFLIALKDVGMKGAASPSSIDFWGFGFMMMGKPLTDW